jgi:uncharacterized protein YecT (DUF1311 family)
MTIKEDGSITWKEEEQKEIDRIIKSRLEREKAKYEDYDTLKKDFEELSSYKANAEYNLQQEVKKALEKKEQELKDNYEKEISQLKSTQVRDKVLSAADVKLPNAYKQMIKASDDEEEVKKSLEEVTKQWKEEMKELGLNKSDKDIGSPGSPGDTKTTKKFTDMSYQEKKALYEKDPELYRKLRDN